MDNIEPVCCMEGRRKAGKRQAAKPVEGRRKTA
jgi:hypothetical protein